MRRVPITKRALVVGGGIAGIEAALQIADCGVRGRYGRAGIHHRRTHGQLRQDLPHPGLRGLHSHAEDGLGRAAPEHPAVDLCRSREVEGYVGNFKVKLRSKAALRGLPGATAAAPATRPARRAPSRAPTDDPRTGRVYKEGTPRVLAPEPALHRVSRAGPAREEEGRGHDRPAAAGTGGPIIASYEAKPTALIMILQEVQREFLYLPREALERISRRMDLALSQIYGVATFYKAFSLEPRGRHHVCVCTGTACHVRNSAQHPREARAGPERGPRARRPPTGVHARDRQLRRRLRARSGRGRGRQILGSPHGQRRREDAWPR